MGLLADVWAFIQDNPDRFWDAVREHLRLSGTALLLALAIFVPLGVLVSKTRFVGPGILGVISAARVVPSLAIVFLGYSVIGTGYQTALLALVVLAGPPIVINVDAGLKAVPASVRENARGLGMTPLQAFFRVEVPLAMPVIIGGIRSAAIEIIASAAVAAFIGVRTLGLFLTSGISTGNDVELLTGAIPIAILALATEVTLAAVQRAVSPPEVRQGGHGRRGGWLRRQPVPGGARPAVSS
jgi:osmoprotectant transport system permease protein